jgi:hypothetical protein
VHLAQDELSCRSRDTTERLGYWLLQALMKGSRLDQDIRRFFNHTRWWAGNSENLHGTQTILSWGIMSSHSILVNLSVVHHVLHFAKLRSIRTES